MINISDVIKWAGGLVLALLLGFGGWYFTQLNKRIDALPTHNEVTIEIATALKPVTESIYTLDKRASRLEDAFTTLSGINGKMDKMGSDVTDIKITTAVTQAKVRALEKRK